MTQTLSIKETFDYCVRFSPIQRKQRRLSKWYLKDRIHHQLVAFSVRCALIHKQCFEMCWIVSIWFIVPYDFIGLCIVLNEHCSLILLLLPLLPHIFGFHSFTPIWCATATERESHVAVFPTQVDAVWFMWKIIYRNKLWPTKAQRKNSVFFFIRIVVYWNCSPSSIFN